MAKIIHTAKVRNRVLCVSGGPIVANNVGCDFLALDLDDEWQGMAVTIVLGSGENAMKTTYAGEPVEIPAPLIAKTGWVPVSVVGESEKKRIVTQYARHGLLVVASGMTGGK